MKIAMRPETFARLEAQANNGLGFGPNERPRQLKGGMVEVELSADRLTRMLELSDTNNIDDAINMMIDALEGREVRKKH